MSGLDCLDQHLATPSGDGTPREVVSDDSPPSVLDLMTPEQMKHQLSWQAHRIVLQHAELNELRQLRLERRVAKRTPLDWKDLNDKSPPDREWAIEPWLPLRHPALIAGRGGIGKTLLAQQLGSYLALGRDFIGRTVAPLRVLLWAGEDDEDELWRRQVAISRHLQVPLQDFEDTLEIESFAGRDMTLAALTFGVLQPTKLLGELRERVAEMRAEFVILDNVARIFGGNENDRHQVTTFCACISETCGDSGVVLVAHPSKVAGSEYSGSTAWEGSVRTRLYLGDRLPDESDEDEPTGDVRYLCRRKANYSDKDWVRLEFKDGVLVPDMRPHTARHGEFVKDTVIRAARKLGDLGIHGNGSTRSGDYLPRLAKQYNLLEGISEKQFGASMRELIVEKRLKPEIVGKYANRSPKLGLVAP